jgi:DNA-binding NarL/FixJ family response regulator
MAEQKVIFFLTSRQRQVVGLVRKAKSNKEIAQTLGITERTVKGHLTSIFGKTGVCNRVALAVDWRF